MPRLSPHSPADAGRSSWLREDRASVAVFQSKRPLSLGLWHQLSHFTERRKQGPPFHCNMSQHLAVGPTPSFHYFRQKNELQGLTKIKKMVCLANGHTLLTADKITKRIKSVFVHWSHAVAVNSLSLFLAPVTRLITFILNTYLNAQTISKQYDSIMHQKCSVCTSFYVFFFFFSPHSCLLAGSRVELFLGLKQNNARFVMN